VRSIQIGSVERVADATAVDRELDDTVAWCHQLKKLYRDRRLVAKAEARSLVLDIMLFY